MKTTLRFGPRFSMPINVVTETLGILAVKRAGKSNAAVVMAEEMYDAGIPWVAVDPKGDWWGVRSAGSGNAPGLEVVVFGGEHGDVPLEPTAGRLVADLIVSQRLTCVLDVSEMTKADQRRFLIAFAQQLYKKNREPMHVFCEEADEYIPQSVMGDNATLVGAFETLVKRGGFRGIGVTLITQRSASLNKDVLTQIGTLIALRTTSPQDRKAILGWVETHTDGKAFVNELPKLANGEAVLFSPAFLGTLEYVKFRQRRTFDSGATPEIGKKIRPPARLADVDIEAIKTAMADTIEKAKASDPKELQRRIAQLERDKRELTEDLAKWHDRMDEMQRSIDGHVCEGKAEPVEVPVLFDQHIASLNEAVTAILDAIGEARALKQPVILAQQKPSLISAVARERMNDSLNRTNGTTSPAPTARPREAVADSGGEIGKTEKKLLSVMIQHGPRTHKQLALQSGYSAKSSTISAAMSKLRAKGLAGMGQPYSATELAKELYGGTLEPLPTGPELLAFWRAEVGKTAAAVLDHLMSVYPNSTNNYDASVACDYSPDSSTVSAAMSKLRKLELADGWAASDDFMRSIQ